MPHMNHFKDLIATKPLQGRGSERLHKPRSSNGQTICATEDRPHKNEKRIRSAQISNECTGNPSQVLCCIWDLKEGIERKA
eukprot:1161579-Pelagomonas_calceolata.AAC.19